MNTIAGLTRQMFITMVAGPFGRPLPVFDKPQRFSDFTKKLSETGEGGATHVLKKDWVFSPDLCPEIYRKGTRVVVGKRRIMFLGCYLNGLKVVYE